MPYRITAQMDNCVISPGPVLHGEPTWLITFSGTIQVADAPGYADVTYKFLRSDGGIDTKNRNLHFSTPNGTQHVTTTWTLGDIHADKGFAGWMAIKITSPVQVESNKVFFELSRNTTGGIVQPQQPQPQTMRVELLPQPLTPEGYRPFAAAFMGVVVKQIELPIDNANLWVAGIRFPKLNCSTDLCGDPSKYVLLPAGGRTTPQQLMEIFGSESPEISRVGVCVDFKPGYAVGPSVGVLITYTH